jgi:hypothetical protein
LQQHQRGLLTQTVRRCRSVLRAQLEHADPPFLDASLDRSLRHAPYATTPPGTGRLSNYRNTALIRTSR